jgi:DNA polymerase III delta prime subunit
MSARSRAAAIATEAFKSTEGQFNTRNYCQYNILENGRFTPGLSTISKLPAGAYHIDWENPHGLVFKSRKIKGDEFLNLEESLSGNLFKEITEFWKKGSTFKKFGLLHRRGYLLYGPQGSGKSSIISQTAHELAVKENGVTFICDQVSLMSDALVSFRNVEPDRPVICVFEDIDDIIENQSETVLLALLDGETQIDKVINIATTNYPEKLEDRIIARPRRFDRVIKVDMPNSNLRRAYFKEKLNLGLEDLNKWTIDTEGLSFACLTELVISVKCLDHDYDETLKTLRGILKSKVSSKDDISKPGFALK